MNGSRTPRLLGSLALAVLLTSTTRAVVIQTVPVGNPGNAADPAMGSLVGTVPYEYRIGTYDVTNAQYVEFLNAKASAADPYGLWNSNMEISIDGGITRSGSAGNYNYSTITGRSNMPVVYVSWYDAIRFANWLNNGQGSGDTETGAYTLLGGTPTPSNGTNNNIKRKPGANWFLPSRDEWHKAAYYDPSTGSYFQFPTGSNMVPTAEAPTGGSNSANYDNAVGHVTNVGAYTGTKSPYGAFDMGGNVFQWNETLELGPSYRGTQGGSFLHNSVYMESFEGNGADASNEEVDVGFRVASIGSVPEPTSLVLVVIGALGLLGVGWFKGCVCAGPSEP